MMGLGLRGRRRGGLSVLVGGAVLVAVLLGSLPAGGAIDATPPSNSSPPTISGNARQGQTLTGQTGSWSGSTPIGFAFQWRECDSAGASCTDLAGVTGQTHVVTSSNVGHRLRVLVTASDAAGSASALSGATAIVTNVAPPSNTSRPSISGTMQSGHTLTAHNGSWTGSPTSFNYAWQQCDSQGNNCVWLAGGGTHAQTFALTGSDVGHTMRVFVTAHNAAGDATADSPLTGVITGSVRNTALPTVGGTPQSGQTLTVNNGTWAGSPTAYAYAWQRCNSSGHSCGWISGASAQTFLLTGSDVGHTLRVRVTASNAMSSAAAYSPVTGVVAAIPNITDTAPPTITGTPVVGQTLVVNNGSWSITPTSYSYAWQRCDSNGNNCVWVVGAVQQSYLLTDNDLSHRLRALVNVKSGPAWGQAYTGLTAFVRPATGPMQASEVTLPNRLVISGVAFSPQRLTSRAPFTARFRVTDLNGRSIVGALVYALALPYGWVYPAPEVATNGDGWATIRMTPTHNLPLSKGQLVMFVRARKASDPLLAGVSNRRLVQVQIG
jgi:hypothetical protein